MDSKSIKRRVAELTNEDLIGRFATLSRQLDIFNKVDLEVEKIWKREILIRMEEK